MLSFVEACLHIFMMQKCNQRQSCTIYAIALLTTWAALAISKNASWCPVLAIGSNAGPRQLLRKYGGEVPHWPAMQTVKSVRPWNSPGA
jgi:hypothetical protein